MRLLETVRERQKRVAMALIEGWTVFRVHGDSMLPALRSGDYVLVSAGKGSTTSLPRGSIVVTAQTGRTDVKRIVGLPSERITFTEGMLLIDGMKLVEPYLGGLPPVIGLDFAEYELGGDEYFVMGDNRAHSTDSRQYGPMERERIGGRAVCRIWPPWRWGLPSGNSAQKSRRTSR